jgi:PKD repeat protein
MKTIITKLAFSILFVSSLISAKSQTQNTLDFEISIDQPCAPTDVNILNTSQIMISAEIIFKWYHGADQISMDESPEPIWDLGKGNHEFTLVAEWQDPTNGSNISDTVTKSIIIEGPVDTFYVLSGFEVCPGEEVFFEAPEESNWVEWDFGDNSYFNENTKYNKKTSHSYKIEGSYEVTLIANKNLCGTDTVKQTIVVKQSATPYLQAYTIGSHQVCPNEEIQFDVQTNFSSYLWDFGDGTTSTKKNPVHTYADQDPANYTASVIVTNTCMGSSTVEVPIEIFIKTEANANFDYNSLYNNQDVCPGERISFQALENGIHYWDFGDGSKSDLKNPFHKYAIPGSYEVEHIIINTCGISDTVSSTINSSFNPIEGLDLNFLFDIDGYDQEQLISMNDISICPGELIKFRNETPADMGLNFIWDFGDQSSFYSRDAQHVYQESGEYMVTLSALHVCGGTFTSTKMVHVDNTLEPNVRLGVVPTSICPGEDVYFFDDMIQDEPKYTYSIDFGQGDKLTGINSISDGELFTLAKHKYSSAGEFNFQFSATNACGNSKDSSGTIVVSENPDNKPFYYVSNSTLNEDYAEPEDWSVRKHSTDHEFNIEIDWPTWETANGKNLFIYFWYGGFYPENDAGTPDGIIHFETDENIITGVNINAYVPINQLKPNSIGIAVAYFCNGQPDYDREPEAWAAPVDDDNNIINQLPLMASGTTSLADEYSGITLPEWDGECTNKLLEGKFYKEIETGVYAILELEVNYDLETPQYFYNMIYKRSLDNYAETSFFSQGQYEYLGTDYDSIVFKDGSVCENDGIYLFTVSEDKSITFNLCEDICTERINFISGIFNPLTQEIENKRSVCPNDPVKFQIAGGISYLWNFGDNSTSTEQFPVHQYLNEGIYEAEVYATNACGVIDTIVTKVSVESKYPGVPDFGTRNREFFTNDTIYFEIYNHSEKDFDSNSYLWDFGDGTYSTVASPKHVYKNPGIKKVNLKLTNGCGTVNSTKEYNIEEQQIDCQAIFIYLIGPIPSKSQIESSSVEAENILKVFQIGRNVSFIDRSTGDPTHWEWSFGDGSYSTNQFTNHEYAKDGVYLVTLNIFNENTQCVSSAVNKIIVGNTTCEADFNYIINTSSGFGQFSNESTSASVYYWDFGDGKFSTFKNPDHTFSSQGIYPVCLTIYDDLNKCQASICKEVIYGPSDTVFTQADFSYFVDLETKTASFQNMSSENVSQWYWTFGDGSISILQNPEHTYKSTGEYEVCLNVYDDKSDASHQICKKINVDDGECNLKAGFDQMIDLDKLKVIFKNQTQGDPDKWFWSFGDGITSNQKDPEHVYANPGKYLVALSVRNTEQACVDYFAKFISVGAVDCKADFNYSVDPNLLEVKMNNTSQGPLESFYWEFGDGNFDVSENPAHIYRQAGKYPVLLTVIDENELCMDQVYKEIQVGAIDCSADFNTYIDSISSTVYLTSRIGGNSTQVLWNFGDGRYSTLENPVHNYFAPGYYTIGLNTYDMNSGCMDYFEKTVLIGSEGIDCKANFIYQPDPSLSNAIRFKDISQGQIVSYLWDFGDGTTSSDKDPVHIYEINGYNLVCLTVVNNLGTKNMDCHWVQAFPTASKNCKADFYFTVDSVSLEVNFADKSFGEPDIFNWEFGDGSTSNLRNPSHNFTEKGYYLVKLSVENSATGCKSKDYKLLNVGEAYKLKAAFGYEAESSTNKVSGYPVDFVGTSAGEGATYEWDFGDRKRKSDFIVMDSTSRIITHYYAEAGIYDACLRITDPVTNQVDTYCEKVHTLGAVSAGPIVMNGIKVDAYPNPLVDFTYIRYSLPSDDFIEISIFDALGRRVETLVRTKRERGDYELLWDTKSQTGGTYYLKFVTSEGVITKPLVVNK